MKSIIATYQEAAEILNSDSQERVIKTLTKDGPKWHFERDGRDLDQSVAELLEPCHDGLPFPDEDMSQTYRI